MSNIDKMTINEELFTELTAEEGSVIEGGAWLYLESATAIKAGADFGWSNGDDVYARINGTTTRQTNDVDTGETANFFEWRLFISGVVSIDLFDNDLWPNSDDNLGGFTVGSNPTNGSVTRRISGSGSTYDVTYRVY